MLSVSSVWKVVIREYEYIESKSAKSKENMSSLKNCSDVEYSVN
jgi:hypothetical protein